MRKRKLIISLIIVILIIILGIIAYINSNKLPTEPLSQNQIVELLGKVEEIDNICVETIDELGHGNIVENILYKKDGIVLSISQNEYNKYIYWENATTKEYIRIEETSKIWCNVEPNEEQIENEYKFIKYDKYNNIKCAVIETTLEERNVENIEEQQLVTTARMWVDLKLGVALKTEYKDNLGEEYVSYSTVTLNQVKDEDVQKPNIEGYTEYIPEEK